MVQKCTFWNLYKDDLLLNGSCGTKWYSSLLGNGEAIQGAGRVRWLLLSV